MNGIVSMVYRDQGQPNLYVLLSLANRVSAITLGGAKPQITDRFITTGSLPNALALDTDRLLVLNSGDNSIVGFDLETGNQVPFMATLPPSSNPYGMALGGGTLDRRLYVTGLMSNSVFVFDGSTGINPGATSVEIR